MPTFFKCHVCATPFDVPKSHSKCGRCKGERDVIRGELAKDALGRSCVRCGITAPLVFDHVEDDGHLNRRAGGRTRGVLRDERQEISKIIETGRSERLQLLCPNCNHLKHFDTLEYFRPPTYGPARGVDVDAPIG